MKMNKILIKGGRVIDPSCGRDGRADILIEGENIAAIGDQMSVEGAEIIDASGCTVTPGFVDMHVHLREPGFEYKEDIRSGTRAAARGGFTSVVCMPNTSPVIDDETGVRFIIDRTARDGVVRVYPAGAVTKGQKGEEMAELGLMFQAGAKMFSDDGLPVVSARVMSTALSYSSMFGVPISTHEEDPTLAGDGAVNFGRISTLMGLPGMPDEAETVMIARDLELCRRVGGHLHIGHVSTARSVELIARAKEEGVNVTCEVTPHHLTLTEDLVKESQYDTNTKMKPPLRTEADRQALVKALREGVIDAIATDHAPHSFDDKDKEYLFADNGIIGLETAFALLHDRLVLPGDIPLHRLIEALTVGPAKVLGLSAGTLCEGAPADVTVLRTDQEWAVNPGEFASKGRNTPLAGWSLTGKVEGVIVAGNIVLWGGEFA
ncbi:MAG: dihydroorotase [Clostridia bacterium]